MPFLAQCPFCPTKVRVPNEALGSSIACPQCRNHFTLAPVTDVNVPTDSQYLMPRLSRALAAGPSAPAAAAAGTPVAGGPGQPPSGQPLPPQPAGLALNPWGLAAFTAAGFGLLSASIPLLHVLTLPLSGLAVLLGLVGAVAWQDWNNRSLAVTAGGGGLGFVVLILALFWPGVFGASFALRGQKLPDLTGPVLLQNQGQPNPEAEWHDVAAGGVQWSNVQLQITGFRLEQVQLATPQGNQLSETLSVVIRLRLTNLASGLPVQYAGWGVMREDKRIEPRLTDNQGKVYPFRERLPEGEIKERVQNLVLIPGRFLDDVLVFDLVSRRAESFRLELPAAAWGGEGTVKLRLSAPPPGSY